MSGPSWPVCRVCGPAVGGGSAAAETGGSAMGAGRSPAPGTGSAGHTVSGPVNGDSAAVIGLKVGDSAMRAG